MARLNISVSDDLKTRMDNHPEINWSQTASIAFDQKINELESTSQVNDMTQAIARLKASKLQYDNEQKESGYAYGLEWAMRDASYDELVRLSNARSENYIEIDDLRKLTDIINDCEYNIFEDDVPDSPVFIDGFIEGALEVLNKVDAA